MAGVVVFPYDHNLILMNALVIGKVMCNWIDGKVNRQFMVRSSKYVPVVPAMLANMQGFE